MGDSNRPLQLTDHAGAQFSVSITIDRQAKQFVPTTKVSAIWNNQGAPSTDLEGSDFMVPLGSDDPRDPGETQRLDTVLAALTTIALLATDHAMAAAAVSEALRPARVERLLEILNGPRTADELRKELEDAIAISAMVALSKPAEDLP